MIEKSMISTRRLPKKEKYFYICMYYSKVNTHIVEETWNNYHRINGWLTNCCPASVSASESEAPESHPLASHNKLQPVPSAPRLRWNYTKEINRQKRTKKEKRSSDSNHWFDLLWQLCTHRWLSLTFPLLIPHPLSLSRSLLPPCFLLFSFSFIFALCLLFPPSLLSSRSSPLLAPEQNEPSLRSGTLFLWQCERASKSAGYCSANV